MDDVLAKSATGATLLIVGSLFTKLLTFGVNNLLFWYISPTAFGIHILFEFTVQAALFYSREGVRLACQRVVTQGPEEKRGATQGPGEKRVHLSGTLLAASSAAGSVQAILNFGFVPLLLGVPVTLAFFALQTRSIAPEALALGWYPLCVRLSVVAVLVELLGEPCYLVNQYRMDFGRRTRFEGLAVVAKCVVTFGVVFWGHEASDGRHEENNNLAILAFSCGQLVYSTLLTVLYVQAFMRTASPNRLAPTLIQGAKPFYIARSLGSHWASILGQIVFKHFLTEGDKVITNLFCTLEEQGVYNFVNNYGSLVARLLLAPIEESFRLYLTKLLARTRGASFLDVHQAHRVLQRLLKAYAYLLVLFVLAGVFNSSFLLTLVSGKQWQDSEAASLLPYYVCYVPFLAFNGILEATFTSIANPRGIARHSVCLGIFSVAFFGMCYLFVQRWNLGLHGFILANSCNMALRIAYCAWYEQRYFSAFDLVFFPRLSPTAVKAAAATLMGLAVQFWLGPSGSLGEVARSGALVAGLTGYLVFLEWDEVSPVLLQRREVKSS